MLTSCLSPVLALHPPGHVPHSLRCPDHGMIGLYNLLAIGQVYLNSLVSLVLLRYHHTPHMSLGIPKWR